MPLMATEEQRREAVARVQAGEDEQHVASDYGVKLSTLHGWETRYGSETALSPADFWADYEDETPDWHYDEGEEDETSLHDQRLGERLEDAEFRAEFEATRREITGEPGVPSAPLVPSGNLWLDSFRGSSGFGRGRGRLG
jgi:hypothetical protein